jgi:simple sugar transport system substrate-binding protein
MTRFSRIAAILTTPAVVTYITPSVMAANIFVVGGKPDDPFWLVVKRGAEDAGKVAEAEGGSVTWLGPQNYDNLGVYAAELIRQAIAQGADAIVGPDWVPQAMDPAFQEVVKHKIPLIIYNAGSVKTAEQLGAMNYIGSDPFQSGFAGGEYFGFCCKVRSRPNRP